MRTRDWREIWDEAERLNPWLASPEADAIAADDDARVEAEAQGYALATVRRESGLTREQVAESMGVDRDRISQIELGQVDSLDVLRAYIGAIGGVLRLKVGRGPLSVTLDFPGDDADHGETGHDREEPDGHDREGRDGSATSRHDASGHDRGGRGPGEHSEDEPDGHDRNAIRPEHDENRLDAGGHDPDGPEGHDRGDQDEPDGHDVSGHDEGRPDRT
jgi:transcriptional regulator with XRE-family HTH domain